MLFAGVDEGAKMFVELNGASAAHAADAHQNRNARTETQTGAFLCLLETPRGGASKIQVRHLVSGLWLM
jgi:hypothetical protein